jgi:hypothetical protein
MISRRRVIVGSLDSLFSIVPAGIYSIQPGPFFYVVN